MTPSDLQINESTGAGSSVRPRPQDALLCDIELPLREMYFPLGYPVELLTNHPSVLDAAQDAFGHATIVRPAPALQVRVGVIFRASAVCPPEPARREFNHLYTLVADTENQAVLDLKTGSNFTWVTQATARDTKYLRYSFLEKVVYLLLGASVVTDLHAACVGRNGKGVLLIGDSGAGKTTLAYACARAGWTYTSDDTSYLINESDPPRVIGHSHRARFRPSARNLFPELVSCPLSPRLEGKPSLEVRTANLPIAHVAPEATVNYVIYLRRSPSGSGELVQLPFGTATERAAGDLYSAGEIRARHERMLAALAPIPTFELHYRALEDALSSLEELTKGA